MGLAGAALALCGAIASWRARYAPSTEATTLALAALYFALAPHTFPWYVAIVLPLVALLIARRSRVAGSPPRVGEVLGQGPAYQARAPILAMWLFALWIPFTYIMFAPGGNGRLFVWLSLAVVAVAALPWTAARFWLPSPREERGKE